MGAVTDLHDLALEYLDACATALALTPQGVPPRQLVSSGLAAWDCCPQLAVWVASPDQAQTIPTSPALAPAQRVTKTGSVNLITLLAVVTRCVPVIDDDGRLPDPAAMTAAAAQTDADIWALWNYIPAAVRAGVLFSPRCSGVIIDGTVAQNAQGGCAGWAYQVRVPLDGFGPTVTAPS